MSKISAYPVGSPLQSTDVLIIARSGHNYKIPISAMKYKIPIFGHMLSTGVPGSTTWNWAPGTVAFGATANNVALPSAGTVKNLRVNMAGAQPAGGALVITVFINGAASTLTITVAGGEAAGVKTDLVHAPTFVAGDVIRTVFANANAGTSGTIGYVTFELEYFLS